MSSPPRIARKNVPIALQVEVLFRDGWLCTLCHRPTVFPPAMRLLGELVRHEGFPLPIAYHDPRWRRDKAPLLDHLGCVIDHVVAHVRGGPASIENLAVACNKCNVRKNSVEKDRYLEANPLRRVKGRYGEPKHWESVFALHRAGSPTFGPSDVKRAAVAEGPRGAPTESQRLIRPGSR